jgi:peroxiredoxin
MKLTNRLVAVVVILSGAASVPARAQLKVALVGDPKVGQDAPDFSLSYITPQGPGPADQPFRLRAELGRKVVLVFGTSKDQAKMREAWQALAATRDSLFGPDVVVTGLVRWKTEPTRALAAELNSSIKLLADSAGDGFRAFGVRRHADRWVAYVINPEGRVAYRSRTFLPSDRAEVLALAAAAKN